MCVSVCLSVYVQAELLNGHVRSVLAALRFSLSPFAPVPREQMPGVWHAYVLGEWVNWGSSGG